jgi:hypothetical protein
VPFLDYRRWRRPGARRRSTGAPAPHLDVVVGDPSAARSRFQQHREHAGRRRLARAVRTEEPEDLSLLDHQIDAGDRDQIAEATTRPSASIGFLSRAALNRFLALAPHDILDARLVPAHRPPDGAGGVRE